jgi:hypothetical protein
MRLGPIARACSKKWQGPFGVVCWFWVFSGCSIGQGQSLPPGTADLTSWVSQLGAGDFQTREKATDQLRKLGPEVLPALRSAMNSPDAEIRKRATDLVGELEKREWTRKALAPQLVTLKLNRATAAEALAEYSKASGMRIDFADPRDRTAGKRLDLSLEKLPAWEALRLIKVGFDLREKQDTDPGQSGDTSNPPPSGFKSHPVLLMNRPTGRTPIWGCGQPSGKPQTGSS